MAVCSQRRTLLAQSAVKVVGVALVVLIGGCDWAYYEDDPSGRIVFQGSGEGPDIFVVNADGTGLTNLTNAPGNDRLPWRDRSPWSPDGSQIAFTSDRNGTSDIFLINADGTGLRRLTGELTGEDFLPSWSPDGKAIVFEGGEGGVRNAYIVNVDGSGLTDISNNSARDSEPAWSPDGSKIAFLSSRAGNSRLWVSSADGSGAEMLLNKWVQVFAWAPDGSRIAVGALGAEQGFEYPPFDVFVLASDGTGLTNLTNISPDDSTEGFLFGSWSPDGTQVVVSRRATVSSSGRQESDIFVLAVGGGAPSGITDSSEYDYGPSWSPDGRWVVFERSESGIHVIRPDGTGLRSLNTQAVRGARPFWSPN